MLKVQSTVKAELASYEARFEPRIKGSCEVHVELGDEAIKGSPVYFEVLTGIPDVTHSHFVTPPPPIFAGQPYTVKLVAFDKFGNECTSGGAYVTARLQSQNLPAGQDTGVEVLDEGNGEYVANLTLKVRYKSHCRLAPRRRPEPMSLSLLMPPQAPADVKLMVQVQREKPKVGVMAQPAAEFPPIALVFTSLKGHLAKEEREARKAMQGMSSEETLSIASADAKKPPGAGVAKRKNSSRELPSELAGHAKDNGESKHGGEEVAQKSGLGGTDWREKFAAAGAAVLQGINEKKQAEADSIANEWGLLVQAAKDVRNAKAEQPKKPDAADAKGAAGKKLLSWQKAPSKTPTKTPARSKSKT